jgi:hypothetical protein
MLTVRWMWMLWPVKSTSGHDSGGRMDCSGSRPMRWWDGESGGVHAMPSHQIPFLFRARRFLGGLQVIQLPEVGVHSGRAEREKSSGMSPAERMSAKKRCSSSHTRWVPFGDRFSEPSSHGGVEPESLLPDDTLHVVSENRHGWAPIALLTLAP